MKASTTMLAAILAAAAAAPSAFASPVISSNNSTGNSDFGYCRIADDLEITTTLGTSLSRGARVPLLKAMNHPEECKAIVDVGRCLDLYSCVDRKVVVKEWNGCMPLDVQKRCNCVTKVKSPCWIKPEGW